MSLSLPFDPKLIATTETLPGYQIVQALGVAEGFSPYTSPALTVDGRRASFNDLLSDATLDMMHKAAAQGAQAIVGLRYVAIDGGAMLVYGTAVTIRRTSSDWNQPPIRV